MEHQTTEFRNRMNEVISKLKLEKNELVDVIEELQRQVRALKQD